MRSFLAITTVLSALVLPAIAAADENTEERLTPKQTYYGWQILVSDAATVATSALLLGSLNDESIGQLNFATGYLLGAPIIHAAHGNPGTAVGSLALRAGMPFVGAWVGCAAYYNEGEFLGCLPGAALGMMIGMGGAIAIDSAALGYADAKPKQKTFEVLPSGSVSSTGATFGLQGVF